MGTYASDLKQQEADEVLFWRSRGVKVTPIQAKIITALKRKGGAIASTQYLTDCLYGDDPGGGPLDPGGVIKVQITHLRKKGFDIQSVWGVGVLYAGHPLEEQARNCCPHCGGALADGVG